MTRTVVDLNKVQYARFFYENQHGDCSPIKLKHSVFGVSYNPNTIAFNPYTTGPEETMEERSTRLKIKDHWRPVVRLQFAANHTVGYTGPRALSIWKEWNKRQFKKKK
jgi:hypothetical protein